MRSYIRVSGEILPDRLRGIFPKEFHLKDGKVVKLLFSHHKLELDNSLGLWESKRYILHNKLLNAQMEYSRRLAAGGYSRYEITGN